MKTLYRGIMIGLLAACVASMGRAADWYHGGWQFRRPITVDHTKVYGALTNYPLLVYTTNSDFKYWGNGGHVAQSNGGDLMFTKADGATRLPHEVERYTSTNGELVAWVSVDALPATNDTGLFLYYGNSRCGDMAAATSVWASYYRVFHLAETSGACWDSTAYGGTGTVFATITQGAPGRVGKGYRMDDGYVYLGSMAVGTNWTFEGWFNLDKVNDGVGHGLATWAHPTLRFFEDAGKIYLRYRVSGSTYLSQSFQTMAAATWSHFTVTYDGSTLCCYKNGSVQSVAATITNGAASQSYIVRAITSGETFTGTVDEVRFSLNTRSAEWIRTSYTNQFNPSAFSILDAEERLPSGAIMKVR